MQTITTINNINKYISDINFRLRIILSI